MISTKKQALNRQLELLAQQNCTEILAEKMTWTKASLSELDRLKYKLHSEDTIVVENFSRLGRSTKKLIELITYFEERNIKLVMDCLH